MVFDVSESHERTIDSQKMHIEQLESTCGDLKRDLNSWQGAVTQKDVALSDALNQLAVCISEKDRSFTFCSG